MPDKLAPDTRRADAGRAPSDLAVYVRAVTQELGKRVVLRDVDLEVSRGESVAIVGRSGSGKTTLLSCILGLVGPTSGEVFLAGRDMRRLSRRARARHRAANVGAVFQHGELVGTMTAEENVALPALMSGRRDQAFERARALLDTLEVRATTKAQDLSGGEIQRTALARALINAPQVVLADEPTGSLDTELREKAADLLFRVLEDQQRGLLLVTHDPALAERADRTFEMRDGRLVER